MNKKLLILGVLCSLLLFLGGCPIPLNVAICGNDICETGEQQVCPGDCIGIEATATEQTCADIGGDSCTSSEMCSGYWLDSAYTCCSETCDDDITMIQLKEGWNYVSFPQVQLNDYIEDVFSTTFLNAISSIYTYQDDEWKVWHADATIPSNLETIEGGKGYIFVADYDITLYLSDIDVIVDTSATPHTIEVGQGWNLIGVAAGTEENKEKPLSDYLQELGSTYTSLWEYTSPQGDLASVSLNPITDEDAYYNLIPTHAYWIYVTSDGEIIP